MLKTYLENAPEFPLGDLGTQTANYAQLLGWYAGTVARLNYASQAQARERQMGFNGLGGCPTFACFGTITLCGKCVTSDVPGNVMFGYAANRLFPDFVRNVGAFAAELIDMDSELFEEDYDVFPLGVNLDNRSSTDICSVLANLPERKLRTGCKSYESAHTFTTPILPPYPTYAAPTPPDILR